MNVAIPHWNGRVSPVFDFAGNLLLVSTENGAEESRRNIAVQPESLQARVAALQDSGATVLICGAISKPLEATLRSAGIDVISQICGDVEQVLSAFLNGRLDRETYRMPGCCNRRRFRGGRGGGRCGRRFTADMDPMG